MNKRAAVELSMNFLVVIIISLVVFVFGVSFIYNILSSSSELKDITLEDIDKGINDLMCTNTEKVCLEKSSIELRPGKVAIIGIKILNIAQYDGFKIRITEGPYIDKDNNAIVFGEPGYEDEVIIVKPRNRDVKIEPNSDASFGFGFEAPKEVKKGTYVFNLDIYEWDGITKYDKTQKIYLKIA